MKKIQSVRRRILPRNVNDYSVRPGYKSQPGLTVSGLTDGCLKLSIMHYQLLVNKSAKKIQSVRRRTVQTGHGGHPVATAQSNLAANCFNQTSLPSYGNKVYHFLFHNIFGDILQPARIWKLFEL